MINLPDWHAWHSLWVKAGMRFFLTCFPCRIMAVFSGSPTKNSVCGMVPARYLQPPVSRPDLPAGDPVAAATFWKNHEPAGMPHSLTGTCNTENAFPGCCPLPAPMWITPAIHKKGLKKKED
jgi:hypothetical protein